MERKSSRYRHFSGSGSVVPSLALLVGIAVLVCASNIPAGNAKEVTDDLSRIGDILRQIQIAVERYAVDHGGTYPLFLTGGEPEYNLLTEEKARLYKELKGTRFPWAHTTGSRGARADEAWCKETDCGRRCMDPLLAGGYLKGYPENPLASDTERYLFGAASPLNFPAGGRKGNRMWELSLGWGDTPIVALGSNQPALPRAIRRVPLAGNFYYHPVFCDAQSVAAHHHLALGDRKNDPRAANLFFDVCGYVLVGLGGVGATSLDFTHLLGGESEIPWAPRVSLKGTVLTGYFSFEDDPYACTPSQAKALLSSLRPGHTACTEARVVLGRQGSGPDGVPDGAAVILYGGLDEPPLTLTARTTDVWP
jgi:hypothetical protein